MAASAASHGFARTITSASWTGVATLSTLASPQLLPPVPVLDPEAPGNVGAARGGLRGGPVVPSPLAWIAIFVVSA
jgi:hypothetical protein